MRCVLYMRRNVACEELDTTPVIVHVAITSKISCMMDQCMMKS